MVNISESIKYVGVNDKTIDLFEGQYVVPNGVSYNSYVIIDNKIAVLDTVDKRKTAEWLDLLEKTLNGRKPDYLVISHMEPDHSASVNEFMKKYPSTVAVGNEKTFSGIGSLLISPRKRRRVFFHKIGFRSGERGVG